MIITVKKNFLDLLSQTTDKDKIFIIGCAGCATKCNTGSESAVLELSETFQKNGRIVNGSAVLDTACDIRIAKKELAKNAKFINSTIVVALTCGAGIQAIEKITDLKIIAGLDGLFVGTTERIGVYNQYCSTCGQCIVDKTAGICPVTRCSKGLINGPCGGFVNGKCEVDPEKDCAWVLIYEKLKKTNSEEKIKNTYLPPRNIVKPKNIVYKK
ncbi:MAG: methylenetetrahydrofolate reductase C-terminal domain-containing protein [Endomicrobiaceae bacterium]